MPPPGLPESGCQIAALRWLWYNRWHTLARRISFTKGTGQDGHPTRTDRGSPADRGHRRRRFATGNPVIAGIVGGIGVNWAANLSQKAWERACRRLLGASGLLNHDLQQAMLRAFRQAIDHLERSWWQRPQVDRMRRREPDVAALALHEERLAVYEKLGAVREQAVMLCDLADLQRMHAGAGRRGEAVVPGQPGDLQADRGC